MNRKVYLLFAGGMAFFGLLYLFIILTSPIQPTSLVVMGFIMTQCVVFLIIERPALKNRTKTKTEFAVKQYSLNARRLYMVITFIIFFHYFTIHFLYTPPPTLRIKAS